MALCAVIATTLGNGQAKPRLAFALIFGVIALFFVILFVLQRADLGRAESGSRAPDLDPGAIEDPIAVDEPTLWASMAVKPIDEAARRARATMWAPLGLTLTGRPKVALHTRGPVQPGFSAGLDGPIVFEGERHGRRVTVTLPPLTGVKPKSLTTVESPVPEFALKARYQRLHAADGAPQAVERVLVKLAPSERWTGVAATAGPGGIAFERKGDSGGEWLLDLCLADALGGAGAVPVSSSS